MIILSSLLCYLSCDQTLDCVESEWTEIKLFERFFRTIRATVGNLFSNCPARQTGNSRRVDFASCNPCQVRTAANLGLVETILADLKFVSRSKTQQQRLPPGKALLTAKHQFSSRSSFEHSFSAFISSSLSFGFSIYATSLSRHLHFPSSIHRSIPLAGADHPSKVHAGARIPSELYSCHQKYGSEIFLEKKHLNWG